MIFFPLLWISTTITSLLAFLLKSVRLSVEWLLPLHTTVHTLFFFLMSSLTGWFCFLLFLSVALVDKPHSPSVAPLSPVRPWPISTTWRSCVGLLWTVGGGDSSSLFKFNAGSHSLHTSCCRWCLCCRCRWCHALHNCDVLSLCSPFLCISHLLFAPAPLSSFWCPRPQAECCPLCSCGWSRGLRGPFCWFPSPPLSCLSGGLRLLCAPAAECDVVFFAVRTLLLYVAAERALLCATPYDIELMGAGVARSWAIAACRFATALAL